MVSIKESLEAAGRCIESQVSGCNGTEREQEEEDSSNERKADRKPCPSPKDNNIAPSLEEEAEEEDPELAGRPKSTPSSPGGSQASKASQQNCETAPEDTTDAREPEVEKAIELRFLVRRREAGALIGKKGCNIKRLRETFRSSIFSIPDTGNGPERVVCMVTDDKSIEAILADFTQLLMEKSPENDEQIELKLLIHSSHAGSIIGIGGQSIKKLRNDSKAAIKIYEMCCPLSNERVCAIKAKPAVVVRTIRLIQSIFSQNPIKGTIKPYDALNFDLNLIEKYGGYSLEDALPLDFGHLHQQPYAHQHPHHRQPYPAYLGRQQLAFEAAHRLQLEQQQRGPRAEVALAKGFLSTGQNFSIWRAAESSGCSLEVSPDPVILSSGPIPELEPVSAGEAQKEPKVPSANPLTQRLVMLKPRFQAQNGTKAGNFGPISGHNLTATRMNPYARNYQAGRQPRNQLFSFPNNHAYLEQQQQQRLFQRQFEAHQASIEAASGPVELVDPSGRCRQRPYLCMFYPSLPGGHQQPFGVRAPAALVRPRLDISSQQLVEHNQPNWLHQIHYIQAAPANPAPVAPKQQSYAAGEPSPPPPAPTSTTSTSSSSPGKKN